MDEDCNGVVDFQEFVNYMMEYSFSYSGKLTNNLSKETSLKCSSVWTPMDWVK